jgi:hypothetical protein
MGSSVHVVSGWDGDLTQIFLALLKFSKYELPVRRIGGFTKISDQAEGVNNTVGVMDSVYCDIFSLIISFICESRRIYAVKYNICYYWKIKWHKIPARIFRGKQRL